MPPDSPAPVLVWRRGEALLAAEVDAVVEVSALEALGAVDFAYLPLFALRIAIDLALLVDPEALELLAHRRYVPRPAFEQDRRQLHDVSAAEDGAGLRQLATGTLSALSTTIVSICMRRDSSHSWHCLASSGCGYCS